MSDLVTRLYQSTADKLLTSISYPLNLFVHDVPFPQKGIAGESVQVSVPAALIISIVQEIEGRGPTSPKLPVTNEDRVSESVKTQIGAAAKKLFEDARSVLKTPPGRPDDAQIASEIQRFIDAGIKGLETDIRGWPQWKVHLRYLRIDLNQRPSILLGAPHIDVNNLDTGISLTGELWFYGPKPIWDWPWNWPIEWQLWVSVPVSFTTTASGYIDIRTDSHLVTATCSLNNLIINVPILDLINLADVGNQYLGNNPLITYDTRELVTSVPLISEKFQVSSVNLPNSSGMITVEIDIAKL